MGGEAPQLLVLGSAEAAQTPKIDDFRPAQKPCIKNPSVPSSMPISTGEFSENRDRRFEVSRIGLELYTRLARTEILQRATIRSTSPQRSRHAAHIKQHFASHYGKGFDTETP